MGLLENSKLIYNDARLASEERGWPMPFGPFMIVFKYLWNHVLMVFTHMFPAKFSPLFHRARGVKIGRGCFVHNSVIIDEAYPENITIGNDVRIAAGSVIVGHMRPGKKLREDYLPTRIAKVRIGDYAFIGINCVIMPGVNVAEGTVVTPGAVLMTNTKPYTVYGGNPAKKIKELNRNSH